MENIEYNGVKGVFYSDEEYQELQDLVRELKAHIKEVDAWIVSNK